MTKQQEEAMQQLRRIYSFGVVRYEVFENYERRIKAGDENLIAQFSKSKPKTKPRGE